MINVLNVAWFVGSTAKVFLITTVIIVFIDPIISVLFLGKNNANLVLLLGKKETHDLSQNTKYSFIVVFKKEPGIPK